jgi:hypothetical protein
MSDLKSLDPQGGSYARVASRQLRLVAVTVVGCTTSMERSAAPASSEDLVSSPSSARVVMVGGVMGVSAHKRPRER